MDKQEKPFILEMEETKLEMVRVINNAIHIRKIPCYIINTMLSGICSQVEAEARNELEIAKQQMKEQQPNNDEEVA